MAVRTNSHRYLDTGLTPVEYYQQHAATYVNPHAEAVAKILTELACHLHGRVLDIGCGDGLATKVLTPLGFSCVGVDRSEQMIGRYRAETGCRGHVITFGEPLPEADSAVASYALHLARRAELAVFWSHLGESGIDHLVTISPHKERPPAPAHYFQRVEAVRAKYGPAGKTVHGAVFARRR